MYIGSEVEVEDRPAGWVEGMHLACQPLGVRCGFGPELRAREDFYVEAARKWLRSATFWETATDDEAAAMRDLADPAQEGSFFVPEGFRDRYIVQVGEDGIGRTRGELREERG